MQKGIVLVLISITCFSCGGQQLRTEAINKLTQPEAGILPNQIDSIYTKLKFVHNGTQVAIAVMDSGQVMFYGVKKERDTLRSLENKSNFFEIGSISKVITSTILAGYLADGKLNQQDMVRQHLKISFRNNLDFSFEELANHTSGLPRLPSNMRMKALLNPSNPYKNYDVEMLNDYLTKDLSLESKPGTKLSYSNLGVGLLAHTLQQYTGLEYEVLAKNVFKKYGLAQSTTLKTNIADKLVEGLDRAGEVTPNWEMNALIGAGGIYSSVEELSKFAMAHFDSTDKALQITRTQTFKETENTGIGLGWFIVKRKNGDVWYWHNGATGGYTSCMVIDPVKKNGVIILSNISAYHVPDGITDNLCFALMRTLN